MTEHEIEQIRADFPLIHAGEVIYFDNAATMQKPQVVIERVREFYEKENANTLRGLYGLSVQATENVEAVRKKVADFMGADRPEEIIFTRSATEAINLTAKIVGEELSMEDNILLGLGSHHSNLIPWVMLQHERGVSLTPVLMADDVAGKREIETMLNWNTEVVVSGGMSNVTGAEMSTLAIRKALKDKRKILSVDLAQTIAHRKVNVKKEKIDFAQWSGHKIGAPMGVGVMYGRYNRIKMGTPLLLGGEMVDEVKILGPEQDNGVMIVPAETPRRYEAGTLNVEGILGLGVAIDYWQEHELEKLFKYVNDLTKYAEQALSTLDEVGIIGAENGIIAFKVEDVHPHDVAQILAEEKICVRAGYHCAQPLLDNALRVGPVVRASLTFYNTRAEIDRMVTVLKSVRKKMDL